MKKCILIFSIILSIFYVKNSFGQVNLSLQDVMENAIKNSSYLQYNYLDLEKHQFAKLHNLSFSDPIVSVKLFEQQTQTISVKQSFSISDLYLMNSKLAEESVNISKDKYLLALQNLKKDISKLYLQAQYLDKLTEILKEEDVLLNQLTFKYLQNNKSISAGERLLIDNTLKEVYTNSVSYEIKFLHTIRLIKAIIQENRNDIVIAKIEKMQYPDMYLNESATVFSLGNSEYRKSLYDLKLEKTKFAPKLFLEWNHRISKVPINQLFNYFEIGISIPLFFGKYNSAIKQANFNVKKAQEQLNFLKQEKWKNLQLLLANLDSIEIKLNQFDNVLLKNADKMLAEAQNLNKSQQNKLLEIVNLIHKAYSIRMDYITEMYNYNNSVIEVNYVNGVL